MAVEQDKANAVRTAYQTDAAGQSARYAHTLPLMRINFPLSIII